MNSNIKKVQSLTNKETTTHEGGKAYELSLKEEIATFFSLGLLRGTFYQTEEEILKNGRELFERALKECPEFATKAAIYGNNENSLKLVPMIWLIYVSTLDDKTLFKAAFPRIIRNPGMLYNFMELVRKGNIRQGLGRALKKEMNDWMIKNLNEYQVSRNKGKLSEVIKTSRPACNNEEFQKYMKYLSKDELTFDRVIALKDVINSLSEGVYGESERQKVKEYRLQLEELKHATGALGEAEKKQLYMDMYESLSYAALILNIVALERVYAVKTNLVNKFNTSRGYYKSNEVIETNIPQELIDMVVNRINDIKAYHKSNMLPFALINAERMVVTPEFKQAISSMFAKVSEELFNIDDDISVLLGVDTSGSMDQRCTDTLTAAEIACVFGGMLRKSHPNTDVVAVATTAEKVAVTSQMNVMEMAKRIEMTDVGYATMFGSLMKYYDNHNFVLLITDGEQADNLELKWKESQKPDNAKIIIWQLVPNRTKISRDPSIIHLCGYSDRILSLIKKVMEGKLCQVDEIEKISL